MIKHHLPEIVGSAVADIAAALIRDMPGGNTLAALTGGLFEELQLKRAGRARQILLGEVRKATRPIKDVHEHDEIIAIVYRYLDASRQGAARLNLSLMAKVVSGQIEKEDLRADEFLRYADVLSTLARDEVTFLATLHKHFSYNFGDKPGIYGNFRNDLKRLHGKKEIEIKATAAAIQRTGLILPIYSAYGSGVAYHCEPSPFLTELIALASFDDALNETPPD